MELTTAQAAHVAKVHPECRAEMAKYLASGAAVVIGRRTSAGLMYLRTPLR